MQFLIFVVVVYFMHTISVLHITPWIEKKLKKLKKYKTSTKVLVKLGRLFSQKHINSNTRFHRNRNKTV